MAADVTWETLRRLAQFRAARGCAVSLYLNLDPSEAPTASDAATRIRSLLSEAARHAENGGEPLAHERRQGLRADLERIRGYLDGEFDRDGARGAAVFASGPDGVFTGLALTEPVEDQIKVESTFCLVPLVPLVTHAVEALVVAVGREQGRFYRLAHGRLDEVADRFEKQPGQHDQGGWSQARFERHIDKLASDHLRRVAEELERTAASLDDPAVVVACAEESRGAFRELLAPALEGAVAGWVNAEAHARPAELLALAQPVLDEWRALREERELERWREEVGRGGRGARGWEETLAAASDARVALLLFQSGVDRDGWECPRCTRAAAAAGSCPLDGAELEHREGGALDLALRQTLVHGGSALLVEHRRDLEPVEGVGARLRY